MALTSQVLVIDPQPILHEALTALFAQHGEFSADFAPGVDIAEQAIAGPSVPEVVLISNKIDDLMGTVQRLRGKGYSGPILMICEDRAQLSDEKLQEYGVQGVLIRPIRFGVLVARLRQVIREYDLSDEAVVAIGPYLFRPGEKLLESDAGEMTKLTDKEAAILRSLHRAGNRAVTRETLLEDVWGYNSGVTTHTLETHIYRLRQKLEPGKTEPTLLVTDQGGYRLVQLD